MEERVVAFDEEAAKDDGDVEASGSESDNDDDDDFHHAATDRSLRKPTQNRLRLTNAAKQAVRTGTTPGAAALILSGGFVDAGIVTEEDASKICTRGKLQREIERVLDHFQVRLF